MLGGIIALSLETMVFLDDVRKEIEASRKQKENDPEGAYGHAKPPQRSKTPEEKKGGFSRSLSAALMSGKQCQSSRHDLSRPFLHIDCDRLRAEYAHCDGNRPTS